jgi:hypothetical protein
METPIDKPGHLNAEAEVWIDSADVKIIFKISESTLYRLRKAQLIPCTKLNGKYVYPKHHLYHVLLCRSVRHLYKA